MAIFEVLFKFLSFKKDRKEKGTYFMKSYMKSFFNDEVTKGQLIILILVAYLFGIDVRLDWVDWAIKHPEFFWNGELMINTNDGYFFASGAQKELFGLHSYNPRVPGIWEYGTVFFTYIFTMLTPFKLETIILYMPAFIYFKH